MQTILTQT